MWAGVATELHVFPGTCHGFDSLFPEWETSQQLFELQGAALHRALLQADCLGQRRGKPSAWIGAEWAARSDEAHGWPPMSLVDSILTSDVCQSLAECEASARSAAIIRYAFTLGGWSVPPEWI